MDAPKVTDFINIKLLLSLFYTLLTVNYARQTKSRLDDVVILILFMLVLLLGMFGYGESIIKFNNNNRALVTIVVLSLNTLSYITFLKSECPVSYTKIIAATVLLTLIMHNIFSI